MARDLERKLARLGPPPSTPSAAMLPIAGGASHAIDRDEREHPRAMGRQRSAAGASHAIDRDERECLHEHEEGVARMHALLDELQARHRSSLRASAMHSFGPAAPSLRLASRVLSRDSTTYSFRPAALPGETLETPQGPLHRIVRTLEPGHHHGRTPIAGALAVDGETLAALALDPALGSVDPRRMLFFDTETTGLSGGTGTLVFLVGMAWFENERLTIEQLFLRRPGEERPLLIRLAERLEACDALVSYNGKAFDWPLLRTRAVLNRVALPTPPAHLDLLHCARRVFARRLGPMRLVHVEGEVLGMRRERDIEGAEIPQRYWNFVRGGPASEILPVIEHNAHDVVALAALIASLGERWNAERSVDEPADHLGMAEIALRAGDLGRALAFAVAAAQSSGIPDLCIDGWLLASRVARARARRGLGSPEEIERWLRNALEVARDDAVRQSVIHLALAKHLEHVVRDPAAALAHAAHTTLAEGEDAHRRRIARLLRKLRRRGARNGRPESSSAASAAPRSGTGSRSDRGRRADPDSVTSLDRVGGRSAR